MAIGAGDALLERAARLLAPQRSSTGHGECSSSLRLGSALLAGLGALGWVGMVLGLAHAFSTASVAGAGVAIAICTHRRAFRLLRSAASALRSLGALEALAVVLLAVLAGSNYLASLAPATADDALSYHLPDAHHLVAGHVLWLNLGGHPFYGNLPKLVETLFAAGIALDGDALAQALHFTVLIGLLVYVYGSVTRYFGTWSAIVAVLGLLVYGDLVRNASSALIDAAVVSFEVAALVAAADWVARRSWNAAARAAVFGGFAAASKYSALVTLGFVAVTMATVALRAHVPKDLVRRAAVRGAALAFSVGGFWYLKNAVRLGNPTYPLYFGHPGMPGEQYRGIVHDVQQFGPRTLDAFVQVPKRFNTLFDLLPFASFFAAPLALAASARAPARRFVLVLLGFAALYVPYWFFLGSHQIRFLMPAVCALLILTGVALGAARRVMAAAPLYAVLAVVAAAFFWPVDSSDLGWEAHALTNVLTQRNANAYALGRKTRTDYLTGKLGCGYAVVDWLNRHSARGDVLDTWSKWLDPTVAYYLRRRHLVSVASPPHRAQYRQALALAGVHFYYIRAGTRARWEGTTDPIMRRWVRTRLSLDRAAASWSKVIYRRDDCELRKIT